MVVIALTAAIAALLAQHLGLAEEVANIALKISQCPRCSVFWATLAVLLFAKTDIVNAVALSLIMAYLSYWFGILLIIFQKLYNALWKRIELRSQKQKHQ